MLCDCFMLQVKRIVYTNVADETAERVVFVQYSRSFGNDVSDVNLQVNSRSTRRGKQLKSTLSGLFSNIGRCVVKPKLSKEKSDDIRSMFKFMSQQDIDYYMTFLQECSI